MKTNTTMNNAKHITTTQKFNWPIVSFLFFTAAIPGLPSIVLVAMVLLGPPADGSVSTIVNMVHFITPTPILLHAGAGILFFLTMPFQFSPALREKHPKWHKNAGRIAIISGYVMALSAFSMHDLLSANSGLPRYLSHVAISTGMIISFTLALMHIIKGNVKLHRVWMIRGVAITFAAITPLFLEGPIMLIFGGLDNLYPGLSQLEYGYGRWLGIFVNLFVVQYFINKTPNVRTKNNLQLIAQ